MHGNEVFQRVRHALAQVEAERNVRVLFACESGSRAWGFASRDSDYDVRFLYVHRRDWYLSVEDKRDVIEQPIADDLDVNGWELRKALRLLRKSNPPLLEWLKSPVVYRHDPVFAAEFGALATEFYSPRRCFAHYLHMAFGNWREYLRLARPPSATIPRRRLGGREEVARKQAGEELAVAPPVEVLTRFIKAELPRLEALNEPDDAAGEVEELNGFFRRKTLASLAGKAKFRRGFVSAGVMRGDVQLPCCKRLMA